MSEGFLRLRCGSRSLRDVACHLEGRVGLTPDLELEICLCRLVQDATYRREIFLRERLEFFQLLAQGLPRRDTLVRVVVHEVAVQAVALGAPLVLLDLAGWPDGSCFARLVLLL